MCVVSFICDAVTTLSVVWFLHLISDGLKFTSIQLTSEWYGVRSPGFGSCPGFRVYCVHHTVPILVCYIKTGNRDGVVSIVVRLQAEWSAVRIPAGARDRVRVPLSLQWVLSEELSGWEVELTTHLHLVPKLRMSGVVPLLSVQPHGVNRDSFTTLKYTATFSFHILNRSHSLPHVLYTKRCSTWHALYCNVNTEARSRNQPLLPCNSNKYYMFWVCL